MTSPATRILQPGARSRNRRRAAPASVIAFSPIAGTAYAFDQLRSRTARVLRQEADLPPVAQYRFTLGHGSRSIGVLGAFAVNIGTKQRQREDRIGLVENRYVINHLKRRDQFGTILLKNERPRCAFVQAYTGIAVNAHYQDVTERF